MMLLQVLSSLVSLVRRCVILCGCSVYSWTSTKREPSCFGSAHEQDHDMDDIGEGDDG